MLNRIVGFINAVYNFFVGDPVILSGVVILFIGVSLLAHSLASMPLLLGAILILGVIGSLALALYRETQPRRK
jgi:hypothetical protein